MRRPFICEVDTVRERRVRGADGAPASSWHDRGGALHALFFEQFFYDTRL